MAYNRNKKSLKHFGYAIVACFCLVIITLDPIKSRLSLGKKKTTPMSKECPFDDMVKIDATENTKPFCLDIREVTDDKDEVIVNVTWNEAISYCQEHNKYLPTADEWDAADKVRQQKGLEGLENEIKEWVDAEDRAGKKYFRPFRPIEKKDITEFPDEAVPDIGFRCAAELTRSSQK